MLKIKWRRKVKIFPFLRFYFLLISIIVYFSGCVNQEDIEKATKLEQSIDTMPAQIIYNMKLKYSEEGKIKFIVSGNEAQNYMEKNTIIFPKGFNIDFYDDNMILQSSISANYGISTEDGNKMEAKSNVILINHESKETLYTESLIYNRSKSLIYSDIFVKITTPTDTIYGDKGFQSDETFSNWKINKPTGKFIINEDENK